MAKILVTGGASFVGSHILDVFLFEEKTVNYNKLVERTA